MEAVYGLFLNAGGEDFRLKKVGHLVPGARRSIAGKMGESDGNVYSGGDVPFEIPPFTLGQISFQALSAASPDEELTVEAETGKSITNAGYVHLCVKTAEALRDLGFEKGDCVGLLGKQGIDISAAASAALFLGGKFAPMDPSMKQYEIQQLVKLSQAKVLFCDAEISELMSEVVPNLDTEVTVVLLFADPESEYPFKKFEEFIKEDATVSAFRPVPSEDTSQSIAILAFSSGSTGLPKAVMLSDKAMVFQLMTMRFYGAKASLGNSLWLQVSHFFWITGITSFLLCTCGAQKRILIRNVTPQNILKAIDTYKPMITFLPPAHIDMILNDPDFDSYDLSSLKLINCGGAALQKSTYDSIKSKWPNPVVLLQTYGCTEVGGLYTSVKPGQDITSVGELIPGAKVKIVKSDGEAGGPGEEGEICMKSEALMNGYANNEEATKDAIDEEGWFHSGDTGYYDGGLLYVRGRIKELIKYKGMQIAPAEIEELIRTVPGVADVGVAGIKHDPYTYYPMALVVKEEGSEVTEEDIIKCVNENLSDYKHLRGGVCFVEEIPRTPTGKIKRLALQTLAETLYMGD